MWRLVACSFVTLTAAGGAYGAAREILPADGQVAKGVRIGGVEVSAGSAETIVESRARALLDRRLTLTLGANVVLETTYAELGATIDTDGIAKRIASVGREGEWLDRVVDALEARRGTIDVPISIRLPIEPLAERLERLKEETDTSPRGARFDFATGKPTADVPGRYVDLYAAASAIERAAQSTESRVVIPMFEISPRASSAVVARIDKSKVLATYSTRYGYVGGQAGRAQNVVRAAAGVDGVVLLPGEMMSFNEEVGPRSEENGFTTAPEIYKGEMREGIGGGTCQVASTLHAAAYLGGFDVVDRINHSRPSGYIPMGLDATVVYPHVDLKVRNPYPFPIVIHAIAEKGSLTMEIRGNGSTDAVEWTTATIGVSPYKRKIEEHAGLAEGKTIVKQKGIRGYRIRKTRIIRPLNGEARVEEKTDVYPPTFEIFMVPPGTDPAALPPLPSDETNAKPTELSQG
ncbi:MAG: VanW family protein [Polyangiaceae bacterium]|nr:VanW family protein [Polyangiaceae bacterium]